MTYELKPISKEAIPAALDKAIRYRLLNEPMQAESICRDILEIEPDHQDALVTLLLSLTDQFEHRLGSTYEQARTVLPRLTDEYQQRYYAGIVYERRGKAHLKRGGPGSGHAAYENFHQAMECYEKAAEIRPPGNDDAILRWNTCVRIFDAHPGLAPAPEDTAQQLLE